MMTSEDTDILCAMMIEFFHAGEICMQGIERYYREQVRNTDNYKIICKAKGKAAAEAETYRQTHRILRQDEKMNIGKLLETIERVKFYMEKITTIGALSGKTADEQTVSPFQVQQYLYDDAKLIGRILCQVVNIRHDKVGDELNLTDLQIESTLKAFKHKEYVSDQVKAIFAKK